MPPSEPTASRRRWRGAGDRSVGPDRSIAHRKEIPQVIGQRAKPDRFVALHAHGVFVIPNPCDAGSAKVLAVLGFEGLATTGSGFAFTPGRADGGATLDDAAAHVAAVAAATE